jgi:hypothetical protein
MTVSSRTPGCSVDFGSAVGQAQTHGIEVRTEAMKSYVVPRRLYTAADHVVPDQFGSGDWTCGAGEFANAARMGDSSRMARRRYR